MVRYARHPLIYTWLLLVVATVFSFWLGSQNEATSRHRSSAVLTVAVLLIAIIKCRLVIRNYMEVRSAPTWLQWTCDAWLLFNLGMGSSFYWFAL